VVLVKIDLGSLAGIGLVNDVFFTIVFYSVFSDSF